MHLAFAAGDDRSLKRIVTRLHTLVRAMARAQPLVFDAWAIRDEVEIRRTARIEALQTPEERRKRLRRVRTLRRQVLREIDGAEAAGLPFHARDLRKALGTFLAYHGPDAPPTSFDDPSIPPLPAAEVFRAQWAPYALALARLKLQRRLRDRENERNEQRSPGEMRRQGERHQPSRPEPTVGRDQQGQTTVGSGASFLQNEPGLSATGRPAAPHPADRDTGRLSLGEGDGASRATDLRVAHPTSFDALLSRTPTAQERATIRHAREAWERLYGPIDDGIGGVSGPGQEGAAGDKAGVGLGAPPEAAKKTVTNEPGARAAPESMGDPRRNPLAASDLPVAPKHPRPNATTTSPNPAPAQTVTNEPDARRGRDSAAAPPVLRPSAPPPSALPEPSRGSHPWDGIVPPERRGAGTMTDPLFRPDPVQLMDGSAWIMPSPDPRASDTWRDRQRQPAPLVRPSRVSSSGSSSGAASGRPPSSDSADEDIVYVPRGGERLGWIPVPRSRIQRGPAMTDDLSPAERLPEDRRLVILPKADRRKNA